MPKPVKKRLSADLVRDLIFRDRCQKMEKAVVEHVPIDVLASLVVSYSFTPIIAKTMVATYNIANGRFLFTHRDLLYKKHPKLFPEYKPIHSPGQMEWYVNGMLYRI